MPRLLARSSTPSCPPNGVVTSGWWMNVPPVFGDPRACAEPDLVVLAYMLEETDEADGAGRAADQSIMQPDAHELRVVATSSIDQIEAVAEIARELRGGAEAEIEVEAIVVRLERVGDD